MNLEQIFAEQDAEQVKGIASIVDQYGFCLCMLREEMIRALRKCGFTVRVMNSENSLWACEIDKREDDGD